MLPSNNGQVVIDLIVIRANLRWSVSGVADGGRARNIEHWQTVSIRGVTFNDHSGNPELGWEVTSVVKILRRDEDSRPPETRGVQQRRRKDMCLAQHSLVRRLVGRPGDVGSHEWRR